MKTLSLSAFAGILLAMGLLYWLQIKSDEPQAITFVSLMCVSACALSGQGLKWLWGRINNTRK